ncbi:hypothetical protein EXS65_02045 [Candidatus Peribacteria bacterium]|nr:hypothetical protein [Candidatus Peribacteria bacterium]
MPIEAVKIPQNVYVEDKIIGPFSLRQLAITGIGAGIGYMFYGIAVKNGVRNIIGLGACWIPTVMAIAFAFLKINDLSLLRLILLFIESLNKPKERYWSPHTGLSINLITTQATKEIAITNKKITTNASRLAEITRQMEKRQEAINHLSAHDLPSPDALEPVKTQIEKVDRKNQERVDTIEAAKTESSQATTLPVNPTKIQTDGLDLERSIDGIAHENSIYERLIAKQA